MRTRRCKGAQLFFFRLLIFLLAPPAKSSHQPYERHIQRSKSALLTTNNDILLPQPRDPSILITTPREVATSMLRRTTKFALLTSTFLRCSTALLHTLPPRLDNILSIANNLDPPGNASLTLLDVCSDHALLPIHASAHPTTQFTSFIASDRSENACRGAQATIDSIPFSVPVKVVNGEGLNPFLSSSSSNMDNKYVTVIAGVGVQTILSILQPLINDDGHDYRPSFPHLILSPTNTRSTNLEILLSSEILRHYTLQCCKVNIENRRFYFALHLSLSPSILRVSSSDLSTYIAPSDSESLECLYSWSEHQSRWDEMNSRHSSNRGECGAATYTLRERNPYDVHVYFDEAREPEALELRERIRATFPWMRFHQPHRCPIGPHPCAMWEVS